jgi:phage baseplate assembly protein W
MPSIKTPFSISQSGRVSSVSAADKIVEQQIIDVLTTSAYERVMRPLYGATTMQLLFEPVDELIYSEFKIEAMEQLNRFVSGASVVGLEITAESSPYISDEEGNALSVSVQYSMSMGSVKSFSFNIVLPSTLTEESQI